MVRRVRISPYLCPPSVSFELVLFCRCQFIQLGFESVLSRAYAVEESGSAPVGGQLECDGLGRRRLGAVRAPRVLCAASGALASTVRWSRTRSQVHDPCSVGFRQVLGELAFPRLFLFRREHDLG